jgi:hypothetical protein
MNDRARSTQRFEVGLTLNVLCRLDVVRAP